MEFHLEALDAFLSSLPGEDEPLATASMKGNPPQDWAKQVTKKDWPNLSATDQTRAEVKAWLEQGDPSDEEAWLTIMAWGVQHRKSARTSWEDREKWRPIITDLRAGKLDAKTAFSSFAKAKIKGTGPAFYTKVIYFLSKSSASRGYILDQWTAKSMELLQVRSADDRYADVPWKGVAARMKGGRRTGWSGGYVSAGVDYGLYDRYLEFLDRLQIETQKAGSKLEIEQIEEALFSGSSKESGSGWRKYVEANWTPGGSVAHPGGLGS